MVVEIKKEIDFANPKISKNLSPVKIINFSRIEKKWQKKWADGKVFEANPDKRKKFFRIHNLSPTDRI